MDPSERTVSTCSFAGSTRNPATRSAPCPPVALGSWNRTGYSLKFRTVSSPVRPPVCTYSTLTPALTSMVGAADWTATNPHV